MAENSSTKKASTLSVSMKIVKKTFPEKSIPLTGKTFYSQEDVDYFLTNIAKEVEEIETYAKSAYKWIEAHKSGGKVAETTAIANPQEQLSESDQATLEKSNSQRNQRMEKHMFELFDNAEKRAEQIIREAEQERDQALKESKVKAEMIIKQAQESANNIRATSEEKFKEAQAYEKQINNLKGRVQSDLEQKAAVLDELRTQVETTLNGASNKIRTIMTEKKTTA